MNAAAKSVSLGRTGRMAHSPTLLFSNLIIKVDWIRCINQTSLDKVPLMHLWWEGVVTVSLVPILSMACSDSSTKPSNHQWEREKGREGDAIHSDSSYKAQCKSGTRLKSSRYSAWYQYRLVHWPPHITHSLAACMKPSYHTLTIKDAFNRPTKKINTTFSSSQKFSSNWTTGIVRSVQLGGNIYIKSLG